MPADLTLAQRVERRLEVLARTMVGAFVEAIPIYRRLPKEQLGGEILEICRDNLAAFFRCIDEARSPTEEELHQVRASAARRAEERVPLQAVLTAYHVGGRIGWRAMAAEARPDEHEELLVIADRVMDYLQVVTGSVANAYLEEQQHITGEERDARRALAQAIADGATAEVAAPLAARAGTRLATAYLVLVLQIAASPDERDAGVSGGVAARRKLRRVQHLLDRRAGEPVLTLLDAEGGVVLYPAPTEDAIDLPDLVAALASAADAEVLAGAAWRPGLEAVAAATAEAREVCRLAARLGRPTGVYGLDDVLLEHTLTHPADSARRLAGLLTPLESRPALVATLEGWFGADFDRRAAATDLGIHPNTLDYRLRRVAELTGLDVGTATGVQLVGAALTARRLREP